MQEADLVNRLLEEFSTLSAGDVLTLLFTYTVAGRTKSFGEVSAVQNDLLFETSK